MASASTQTDGDHTIEMAAEALLREHPDGLVCGLSDTGLIVPIPQSVGVWGQGAIEGRAVTDAVVAADRTAVVRLWNSVLQEGSSTGKVRLLGKPSRWQTLHFLDLRNAHGVLLGVILPSDELVDDAEQEQEEQLPAAPRFSTLLEDEGAKVLECDEAFTKMFGYEAAELIGNSVLDQIHPDDQGRAVEGWIAMLSTRRSQQTRLRRKRKDGSWVWVDTTLHNFLNQPDRNYVLLELIDVSAEMAAQEALQEREELLRRLTEAMPDGLLQLDTDGLVVYHNARLLQILHGAAADAFVPAPDADEAAGGEPQEPKLRELIAPLSEEARESFAAALDLVLGEGSDQDVEVDFALPSGEARCALMSMRSLRRPSGEVSGAIISALDVTDSVRARHELERRATFDALTGAHNRSSILAAVRRELDRPESSQTAVVYIDLDNFKPVNDTLGHAAGDELLMLVAERLKEVSRREDEVGRLGGDEFIMLLREVPNADVAMQVAGRICASLSATTEVAGSSIELQASVGVACSNGARMAAEELIKRADSAMYRSKEQRRGMPVLDEPSAQRTTRT